MTLTLFWVHTKSVEGERRKESRERGRRRLKGREERKEGEREEACVDSMARVPKEERRL